MTRTLLTGAAGFTGQYVSKALMERGHEVHAVVHNPFDKVADGVTDIYEADLTELGFIDDIVQAVRPDHVIHLAAIAFVAHDDVTEIYRTNVLGTRQLLEAVSRVGSRPTSVVIASSANVYGTAKEGAQSEDQQLAPANDYGVSKVAAEFVASIYRPKLPIIVVRPFNYTGRGQSADYFVPKVVDHARKGKKVIELGNLDVARDFSDVRVVAEAYARLITASEAVGGTFNICSGRAIPLQHVLALVSEMSGRPFEVDVDPALVRQNDVPALWGSPERLRRVVGDLPHIPFEETLRWMLEA